MKKHFTYILLLLFFCIASFYSCGENEDKSVAQKAQKEKKQEEERIEANEKIFTEAYDDIARVSIQLVLNRNYKDSIRPNISKVSLDSLKTKINGAGEVDSIIRTYVDSFIKKRTYFLNDDSFFSEKETFKSNFQELAEWEFFENKIINGSNKKTEETAETETTEKEDKTETLIEDINSLIDKAVSNFTSKSKKNKEQTATIVSTNVTNDTEATEKVKEAVITEDEEEPATTEISSMMFYGILGLLLLSALLNIFLGWKLSKKRPEKINSDSEEINKQSAYQKSVADFEEKMVKEDNKEKKSISKTEIQGIVATEHKKMLSNLSKYSKACLDTVDNLESIKNDVVEIILKKKLLEIDLVKRTATANLDAYERNVVALLKNCNDKNLATQKIKKAVDLSQQDNFGIAKLHVVSKQEVNQKIEQRKNILLGELPPTITTEELTQNIEKLIHTIKIDLNKLIDEASIYYLPFSDANGYFKDSKKSKTKKPDSIIKMQIDSDDPTKATFQFMYEEKNTLKNAILSYDVLLMPICHLKSENFNRQGTIIQQIGDNGTLRLVDDLWQVEEKLNIKII